MGTGFLVQIQEETGYQVGAESLQKVTTYNSSVGTSGSLHHMFTVDIDDNTPHDGGGGLECTLPLLPLLFCGSLVSHARYSFSDFHPDHKR